MCPCCCCLLRLTALQRLKAAEGGQVVLEGQEAEADSNNHTFLLQEVNKLHHAAVTIQVRVGKLGVVEVWG